MALKNLFDMVKADRYTQDGREALIKAQESETEDKIYQIGEISQTTGLQKTANGWVKPKSGKQPGAKNAETNYGKVEKKDGKWGVQQKLGKGSQFIEHKDKKDATEALKNYTEGYNTTARSKQDPHSDEARQVKQWNKETEKIKKENRAERRAEHAAQFQNQPTLSQTDGKGNKVEIKITESKGGGFYIDKYVNGKKVGINNANTRESAEAKAKSMMEQHMADPDYKAEEKPAAPKREAVSAGRMMKDLDGNFWSRPEDFKEDITSRGWDVDEMTNEYAVISNEAGSQYEVRFDDHSDDGDLTVRNFKALQIDEDDDDDSLEDAAPSLSEIVDRVYNIGEISEKTGLQKTANGWVKPKKGAAPAKKEAQKALKNPDAANKAMETNEHVKYLEQDLKQAQRTKAGPDKEFNIKYKILETLAGGTDAAFEAFKGAKTSANTREEALEQALNKYNYSTEKKDKAKKTAGTRHAEKRKTNRPKAIRWDRNNLNEMRGNEEYINAKAADNYYHQYGLDKIGEWKDRKGWTVKEYQNDDGETYRAKYNGEKYVGSEYDPTGVILSPENKDAASRVLTGDCKIRIKRETKDGTYTPESINAPREKLEKKLTGDCKVRVRKA